MIEERCGLPKLLEQLSLPGRVANVPDRMPGIALGMLKKRLSNCLRFFGRFYRPGGKDDETGFDVAITPPERRRHSKKLIIGDAGKENWRPVGQHPDWSEFNRFSAKLRKTLGFEREILERIDNLARTNRLSKEA